MITAEDIRELRTASPDYAETEALKAQMRFLRARRRRFYLEPEELDTIFRWKLRGQYARVKHWFSRNSEWDYRSAVEAAFEIVDPDPAEEAKGRLRALTSIWGVGTPVASAVLALVDPDRHCVVDFRGWYQAFHKERRDFSPGHYVRYRAKVEQLAKELHWSIQETDLAIWEFDRRARTADSGGGQPCRSLHLPAIHISSR